MIYWTEYAERGTWDTADTNWNQQIWKQQLWLMEIWELTYEYFWCAEMICEGMSVISFSSVLKCCLFPPKQGEKLNTVLWYMSKREILSFFCLSFSLHVSRIARSCQSPLLTLPHAPSFLHPYPPFPFLLFADFCLLTFHLSTEQILLQLPKLCQKTLWLFNYFISSTAFSANGSLNGDCAGWSRLIKTLAELREWHFRALNINISFFNSLQLAGSKELVDFNKTHFMEMDNSKCLGFFSCIKWQIMFTFFL